METMKLKKNSKLQKIKKSLFIGCTVLTSSLILSCGGNYSDEKPKNDIEITDDIQNDKENNDEIQKEDKEINDEENIEEDEYKENSLCPKDLEDRFDLDNVSGKFDKRSRAIIDNEIEIKNSPFVNETTVNGEYARLLTYCINDECSEHGITIQENKQYTYKIQGEIITFEGCYVRNNDNSMIFAINKEKTITTFYVPCSLEYDGEEKENYKLLDNTQETKITYGKITGDKCEQNNEEVILKYETSFEEPIKWKNEYIDGVSRENMFVDGKEYFISNVMEDELKLYKEIVYKKEMKINDKMEIDGNEIKLIEINENKITLLINEEERTWVIQKYNGRIYLELNNKEYKIRIYSINEDSIETGISKDEDNLSIRGIGNVGYINIANTQNWEIRETYTGTTYEEGVLGYTIEYEYRYEGELVEDKK
jgi:hypothetical protein